MSATEVRIDKLCEAVAYGDAAGLPVETKSASQIKERYGTIATLLPPTDNPFFAGEYPEGTWSDDTALTLAVAEGIIEADGFDIHAQAKTHIKALDETPKTDWEGKQVPRGFGRSTFKSIERLKSGVSPLEAGEPEGAGNGVIMKLGPLAAWAVYRTDGGEIYQDIEQLTLMTHANDTAIAASQVHMDVLRTLAGANKGDDHVEVLQEGLHTALTTHKSEYPEAINELERTLRYVRNAIGPVSGSDILEHTDGKGFYVPQTLAMVYGAFLRSPRFPESVFTAANLGGDTDSTAAIIAVMSLFFEKDVELPADAKKLHQRERLVRTGRELAKVVGERG